MGVKCVWFYLLVSTTLGLKSRWMPFAPVIKIPHQISPKLLLNQLGHNAYLQTAVDKRCTKKLFGHCWRKKRRKSIFLWVDFQFLHLPSDFDYDSHYDSDYDYTSKISPLRYVLIFVGVIRTNDRTQTGSSYPPSVTALVIYHNCIGEKPYGETIYTRNKKYP